MDRVDGNGGAGLIELNLRDDPLEEASLGSVADREPHELPYICLEIIFSYLSFQDEGRARCVCRCWSAVPASPINRAVRLGANSEPSRLLASMRLYNISKKFIGMGNLRRALEVPKFLPLKSSASGCFYGICMELVRKGALTQAKAIVPLMSTANHQHHANYHIRAAEAAEVAEVV